MQTQALSFSALFQVPTPIPSILDNEKVFILADKLAKTAALYAQQKYKDIAKELLNEDALIT